MPAGAWRALWGSYPDHLPGRIGNRVTSAPHGDPPDEDEAVDHILCSTRAVKVLVGRRPPATVAIPRRTIGVKPNRSAG